MNEADAIKANPMVSTLIALGVVGGSLTAALGGFDAIDNLVVTHTELAAHEAELHAGTQEALDKLDAWNVCDRLERRIDVLEGRLYRLRQAETANAELTAATIRELEQDIAKLERDFEAKDCATVLAG